MWPSTDPHFKKYKYESAFGFSQQTSGTVKITSKYCISTCNVVYWVILRGVSRLRFVLDLLIWWNFRIWEDPVLQLFYSGALIETVFTQFMSATIQPFIHLALSCATVPSLCTWAILSWTASAFSISCFWAAIIWTDREKVCVWLAQLGAYQRREAQCCSNSQSFISNGTCSIEVSKNTICQAEIEANAYRMSS